MAEYFTGINGSLLVDGSKIAKLSDWSFTAETSTLETTSLGEFARTYIPGIQSFSGSSTAYYYVDAGGSVEASTLYGTVIRIGAPDAGPIHTIKLRLDGTPNREVEFKCVVTSVTVNCAAGNLVTANIAFTASGALTEASLAG